MIALARLSLLSALLALLGGCAIWGDDWQEPEVHLVQVETVKARLLEQEFVLHLRIDNPNDSRLFIRNVGYSIWLNDLLLVEDEASVWRSVGGHARRTFKITARTNLWNSSSRWPSCSKASKRCTTACRASWRPGCSSTGTCTYRAVVR